MYTHDIAKLLSEFLTDAGRADAIEGSLDNHTTIFLKMKDEFPSLYIHNEDDDVVIRAVLGDMTLEAISYQSQALLPLIVMQEPEVFYYGQPSLFFTDSSLELRAQVRASRMVSSDVFAETLESFINVFLAYQSALK